MKKTTQTTESFIASLMPDSDRRMWRIAGVSFLVAIALCFWAAAYERLIEDVIFEKTETVEIEATMNIVEHKEENKQVQKQEKKKREIIRKRPGGGGKPVNKGDPRAPERRGVLKLLTAQTHNASAMVYDLAQVPL